MFKTITDYSFGFPDHGYFISDIFIENFFKYNIIDLGNLNIKFLRLLAGIIYDIILNEEARIWFDYTEKFQIEKLKEVRIDDYCILSKIKETRHTVTSTNIDGGEDIYEGELFTYTFSTNIKIYPDALKMILYKLTSIIRSASEDKWIKNKLPTDIKFPETSSDLKKYSTILLKAKILDDDRILPTYLQSFSLADEVCKFLMSRECDLLGIH